MDGLSASDVMINMGVNPNFVLTPSGKMTHHVSDKKPVSALRWKLRKRIKEQSSARARNASPAPTRRYVRSVKCTRLKELLIDTGCGF
ncbi:MAG: hypothetical protein ACKPKO_12010, partial [Candidatus Fonsibacter sp.]